MPEISQPSDKALAADEAGTDGPSPERQAGLSALAAGRSRVTGALSGDGAPAPADQPDKAINPRLSPEKMTELLAALEARFSNTPQHYKTQAFHKQRKGITFAEIKTCLENDPALARIVYAMLKRDGKPDVLRRAGKSFLFFEGAQETCPASRNCVYDKASADWLRTNRPGEQFNGSVEEQRAGMGGAGVASEALWREMQKLGIFTTKSWEWLDSDDIPTRVARSALRDGGNLFVDRRVAGVHRPFGGWRAVAEGSET